MCGVALGCAPKDPLVGTYRAAIVVDDEVARKAGMSADEIRSLHEASGEALTLTLRADHTYAQGNHLSTVEGDWIKQEGFLRLTPKSVFVEGQKATGQVPDYMLEPLTMKIDKGKFLNGSPGMQTVFTKAEK